MRRGARALPLPTGITVGVESPLEDRLQDVHQGVVHDAIPKRRSGNQPRLASREPVRSELAGAVGPIPKLVLNTKESPLQVELEALDAPPVPLPTAGIAARRRSCVTAPIQGLTPFPLDRPQESSRQP